MEILRNIIMIIVFILVGSFLVLRYLSAKDYASLTLSPDSGISELMDSLSIEPVNELWVALDFDLMSTENNSISLSQHRGKFVILGFWTTW
ncbi:MAG: hypothetical protein JSV13_00640 [Nitrospiraceae bacterium]|nr:MAG: hypothetical protein JSV13_00640 [Nitrospiraceae bacterium]